MANRLLSISPARRNRSAGRLSQEIKTQVWSRSRKGFLRRTTCCFRAVAARVSKNRCRELTMIQVEKLSKRYASNGRAVVEALKETTFQIAPGEFVAVRGASGSGKSTLLNIL